jgi:hypothetical protein
MHRIRIQNRPSKNRHRSLPTTIGRRIEALRSFAQGRLGLCWEAEARADLSSCVRNLADDEIDMSAGFASSEFNHEI